MPVRSKILIVDDNLTNIAIMEEILSEHYDLETAASGEEALVVAAHFHPDLVLLDIMMPGIDGYETCRRLRAIPMLRPTKIIMVSAKAMVAERLQGYEAGADDYIAKPFDEDELSAKVRVYLRLKSMEEMDQFKMDLLSFISHKARTPLHGILTSVQMLSTEETIDIAERKLLFDLVDESATRLLRLIEQVTLLTKMRSGQWEFLFTHADLGEVIHSAINAVSAQAQERQVQINQTLATPALTVVDLAHMRQVCVALLENAIQFSPVSGRVAVRLHHDCAGLTLEVEDQGEGIAAEKLAHIFEALADVDLLRHVDRQGLSLAVAQQVVLAHQGTIVVQSTPGVGTTFTVWLPMGTPDRDAV